MKIWKRMPVPWGPAVWSFLAVTSAVNVALDLRTPAWARWPFPTSGRGSVWFLLTDVTLTVAYAFLAVRGWRRAADPSRRLMLGLAAVAAGRRAGTWVNRDDHVVFMVTRHLRFWMVDRIPEDAARAAMLSGEEETPVLYETFICTPGTRRVIRMDDTMMISPGGDVDVLPGSRSLRSLWRQVKISDGPVGTVYAPDSQVAEVTAQLRDAEQITP